MDSIKNFKNIKDYLHHWDLFFEEWVKGESHQKKLLDSDTIWGYHKGKLSKDKKTGKLSSTKLEHDVFPQPYLGDVYKHSAITLNLNPSRSKIVGTENIDFEKETFPKFKEVNNKYRKYAEEFPTYHILFWQKQVNWIDNVFEYLGHEIPSSIKDSEIRPFAIEICPWASKSWKKLKIDAPLISYLDEHVFDVIEKVITNSRLKMVLSVGKAYYDIFNHKKNSEFELQTELVKYQKSDFNDIELNQHNINSNLSLEEYKEIWPKTKDSKTGVSRYVNRSFSIWKRKNVLYYNTWAPGSNTPTGNDFKKIEQKFLRIYKSLLTK